MRAEEKVRRELGGVSGAAYTCNLLKIHCFGECTKSSLNWSGCKVDIPLHYCSNIHHAYEVSAKMSVTRRNITDCFCSLPNFKSCCEMMPLHFKPVSDLSRFLVVMFSETRQCCRTVLLNGRI